MAQALGGRTLDEKEGAEKRLCRGVMGRFREHGERRKVLSSALSGGTMFFFLEKGVDGPDECRLEEPTLLTLSGELDYRTRQGKGGVGEEALSTHKLGVRKR